VLLAGLIIGLLAAASVYGNALGLDVLALTLAVLAGGWVVRRPDRALDPLDLWLPAGAVMMAALVAVRGDSFLAALDTLAAIAYTAAAVVAMSGLAVTRRSASAIAGMGAWVVEAVMAGGPRAVERARPFRIETVDGPPSWVAPLARGLVVGIPLSIIFAILFASADPIFRQAAADALGFRIDLGDLPGRALFGAVVAWLAAGLISVSAFGVPAAERASLGAAARTTSLPALRSLGGSEALAILLCVDLVVGFFVGLQVAYLFGGLDTLAAIGVTYADYARRGFFELLVAASLAAAVVIVLEASVTSRSLAYRAALLALVALTALVLASAAQRLSLYQDAYGWTELRAYVLAAIFTMGIGLIAMAALILGDRSRWLGHAFAVIGIVALVGLNLAAPAALVASRNIERVIDPASVPPDGHPGVDYAYLAVLPDDAIPVLVDALPRLPADDRAALARILTVRRAALAADAAGNGLASWNLGRERARAALATLP
jgi:hypothetical protein